MWRAEDPSKPPVMHNGRLYLLFGLTVRSSVALPCQQLSHTHGAADVELLEATDREISESCAAPRTHFEAEGFWECGNYEDGAARVCWKDHFDFVVSADGTRVLWRRLVGVSDEVLFTYLLNQVLSFCLLARGIEPLHATAIVVGDSAIAFLGDSGFGKSTLAAAMLGKGYPLLTDDVLVLSFKGQEVLVLPSLARIKLTPDSADAFFPGRRSINMNNFTPKMILPLQAWEHASSPVPLRALYLIPSKPSTSKVSIRRVYGRASFLPLIQNTFNNSVLAQSRIKQQFAFASRLVRIVPIKRMSYPKRFDMLPVVIDAILTDVARELNSR
jgi:hypothetical protein